MRRERRKRRRNEKAGPMAAGSRSSLITSALEVEAMAPTVGESAVSVRVACERLSVGPRRIRQLIDVSRLVSIGSGLGRKVTLGSLESEIAKRKVEIETEIHVKQTNSSEHLRKPSLCETTNSGENICVVTPLSTASNRASGAGSPIGELVPIARAARLVGLSTALMARVIRDGSVPSVQVGTRRRVNVDALRRWAGSPEGR
jgi:excisionase family DNA binding protein